jgi:hypothetical protein
MGKGSLRLVVGAMTAEIVLLNREAVVLAADSAATISGRSGTKIYHTENKLFTLSKYRPVGVMIYNNVHLCGVPWETIIKEYRKQLKDQPFNTLSEYVDHFLLYLTNNTYLFSVDQQLSAMALTIVHRLRDIKKQYLDRLRQDPHLSKPAALVEILQQRVDELEKAPILTGFDAAFEDRLARDFRNSVRLLAEDVFERKRFPKDTIKNISRIALLSFTRRMHLPLSTGLVIAGFGEKEIFPRLRCFNIEGVVFGKLKLIEGQSEIISLDNPATWRSFARSEVVSSIIGGVHPAYRTNFLSGALHLVHNNVIAALDEITQLSAADRQGYVSSLAGKAIQAWQKYLG